MDAHSTLAQQVWNRLKKRFSRKAVVALGIIALLGICDTAVAHTMPPLYQHPIATATPHHLIAHKVTGHVTRQITPVTGQPKPTATVSITPTPTAVAGQVVPVTVVPTATPQTATAPLAAPPV
jgi:hypothetical protein